MTGVEMKAEIFVNARSKGEVKLLHHRRKLTKSAAMNGDKDGCSEVILNHNNVNLAAAFHDHMSCTKTRGPGDQRNVANNYENFVSVPLNECENNVIDLHHNKRTNCTSVNHDATRLKELLLLNLQFIKQQNEVILSKDRQIDDLKSRQSTLEDEIKDLKKQIQLQTKKSTAAKFMLGTSERSSSSKSSGSEKTDKRIRRSLISRKRKATKELKSSDSNKATSISEKCDDRLPKNDDYCKTTLNYYVNLPDLLIPEITCYKPPSPEKDSIVQVPSWRYNFLTSCYSMEHTENLDDDVFLKRHLKFELDERRRKRWDIQRIREQRKAEKLKVRYDRIHDYVARKARKHKTQQPAEVVTLQDERKDVKFIYVDENIYASAFSHLIPSFSPSEFAIPWGNDEKEDKATKTKKNRLTEIDSS